MLKTARLLENATGPNSRWTRFAKTPWKIGKKQEPAPQKINVFVFFFVKGAPWFIAKCAKKPPKKTGTGEVLKRHRRTNKTQRNETSCRFVWQANVVTYQLLLTTSWFWWQLPGTRDWNSGTVTWILGFSLRTDLFTKSSSVCRKFEELGWLKFEITYRSIVLRCPSAKPSAGKDFGYISVTWGHGWIVHPPKAVIWDDISCFFLWGILWVTEECWIVSDVQSQCLLLKKD